ncbi:peptidoglycan-binding protein [Nocardioides marmorisolisilvae]|uniref:Peptidoglycan-binding protein n=2 Tax=Nocardioides marmorisolisilvae TaxID=1542737 RepID=A0A3N0DPJ6_9ACTN|nr:peptidoglycan-binding protein [Nocardioides marmorisolisilvae]
MDKWAVSSRALSTYCHGAAAPSASPTSTAGSGGGMRSLIEEGRGLPMSIKLRPVAWREVATLQALLTYLGFGELEPDGHFGPATEASVKAFQGTYALEPDGVVGPNTLQTLLNLGNDEAPETAPNSNPMPIYGGSLCADGWLSRSTGSGTCSWHGGVR